MWSCLGVIEGCSYPPGRGCTHGLRMCCLSRGIIKEQDPTDGILYGHVVWDSLHPRTIRTPIVDMPIHGGPVCRPCFRRIRSPRHDGLHGSAHHAGGSAMDPLWSIIGFDVTSELSLTSDTSAAVALVSMILIVLSLFAARRYDLFAVKMSPETCPAKVKWDEPRIVAEVAQKP